MMLVDVLGPPLRFRYRLVGTQVVAASVEDRTGACFDAVEFFRKNPVVMTQDRQVVDTCRPAVSLEPFRNYFDDTTYEVERLILPLAGDGSHVDMLLVYFSFRTGTWAPPGRAETARMGPGPRDSSRSTDRSLWRRPEIVGFADLPLLCPASA